MNVPQTIRRMAVTVNFEGVFPNTKTAINKLARGNILLNTLYLLDVKYIIKNNIQIEKFGG